MEKFWRIEAKADPKVAADVYIYDAIGRDPFTGEGLTAKQFLGDLKPHAGRDLVVHVNTAGGDVFEGMAILAALDSHQATKTVVIESLAASMGSVIAMAASKGAIRMAGGAHFMIHNPRGAVRGESKDLRRIADMMDSLRANMVKAYQRHTTLSAEQIGAAMDAQTLYNAEQAKAAGFAHEITEPVQIAACLDPAAVAALPGLPDSLKALAVNPGADPAAAALAEAKAAVEGQNAAIIALQAKLAAATQAADASAAAVAASAKAAADTAAAAAAAKAAADQAATDLQARLAAAQAEGQTLQARLASLTGGLGAPGPAAAKASTFAGAVAALQAAHPEWDHARAWAEAKAAHPDLWKAARG